MAFIHNDIATKQRLRDALNEEGSMGFEHNDIVTTDVMNAAIAAGGGGGGDFPHTTFTLVNNSSEESGTTGFLAVSEGYAFDNNGHLDYLVNYGKIGAGKTAVIVAFYVGDDAQAEIFGTPSDIINITMEDTYAVITDITQNSAMTITITD